MMKLTHLPALVLALALGGCGSAGGGGGNDAPVVGGNGDGGNGNGNGNGDANPTGDGGNGDGNGDGGNGGNGNGNATPEPLTCEQLWARYVAAHPKGLVVGYEMKMTVTNGQGTGAFMNGERKTSSTDTILASSADEVKTKNEFQMLEPTTTPVTTSESKLTKATFLENCKPEDGDLQIPAGTEFQVLGRGAEKITVKAGAFDTHWLKGKTKTVTDGMTTTGVSTSWAVDEHPGISARTTTSGSTVMAGGSFDMTIEMELVKLVAP